MSIYDKDGNQIYAAFGMTGDSLATAYNVDGVPVFSSGKRTDYDAYSIVHFRDVSVANTQGMEVKSGVVFQFRGSGSNASINNHVTVFDISTGTIIANNMEINSGHANAVSFGNQYHSESDEFPIIYCGDWNDPIVHINKITRTSATHLYDLVLDNVATGYHCNPCIDTENNIMYTVGYYLNSTEVATGNYCIVCKWNLTNLTDNGDGTYTPELIQRYTRDFIYVMQDLKFNDGYVWIASGYGNGTQYVYGMNPRTGVFAHTITMPITTEIEGLSWQYDEDTELFFAYIGFQGGKYYKATFDEA